MPAPSIHRAQAFEDSGISLMARIVGVNSTNITQAELSSVSYSVYDTASPSTGLVVGSVLTTSAVVFDTLQTPAAWNTDVTGYNFRYDVASTELPAGSKKYRIEFKFTPASGQPFHTAWEISTIDLLGS